MYMYMYMTNHIKHVNIIRVLCKSHMYIYSYKLISKGGCVWVGGGTQHER